MHTKEEKLEAFSRLLDVIDELREKCPWDKKQTNESLRHLTIEEVYELGDAVIKNSPDEIKKELGDVLLHLLFYSKIGSEQNEFDIADVMASLRHKLIYRHPHIYGQTKVGGEGDVKQNWEKLKLKEGNKSVLAGVPNSLPALIKAMRLQEKAAGVGFDWPNGVGALEKIREEIRELKYELGKGDKQKAEEEFGDVLFSLVNYARFLDINPETALELTNLKFRSRFMQMEKLAAENGSQLSEMDLNGLEELWRKAKQHDIKQ